MHPTLYTILPSKDSTLAVEVCKTGLMKRKKHLLFFEEFRGELFYVPDLPEDSRAGMTIDVGSLVCHDKWLTPKKQQEVSRYTRDTLLAFERYPSITFTSERVTPKPLRGFVVEGALKIRDITQTVRANVVLNQTKSATLQVDGDATFRLSDFGIEKHSSFFGLVGTKDEVLIRLLLWATRLT